MAGLTPKVKEQLALLYDYPEFKALVQWSEFHRQKCATALLNVNMGQSGASEEAARLQGQAQAHALMLLEIKKIHKELTKED